MTPPFQRQSDDVSVAPQLGPESMADVAAAGFRSVINNRPDFEGGPEQPTAASIAAAAKAAGLAYEFQPVHPALQTPEDIARFQALLETLPKPILAFCRSGTRSGKLYRAATGA
ncbi:MAG: TIGR01244 family sulfur transferase [Caldimonas sp.]